MVHCIYDFRAPVEDFRKRIERLKDNRKNYVIYIFVAVFLYLLVSIASFSLLMYFHSALTSQSDDVQLPSVIFLSYVILSIIYNLISFPSFCKNFDNDEIVFANWVSNFTGKSISMKVFLYIGLFILASFWIAGWIFISSSGGVDFGHFKEDYKYLAIMMITYWAFQTSNGILGLVAYFNANYGE